MEEDASEDERITELSTIAAIFPELVIDPHDPYTATLDLPVTPLRPLRVQFSQSTVESTPAQLVTPPTSVEAGQNDTQAVRVVTAGANNQAEVHELEHLPPLKLRLKLPALYPAAEPPAIFLVVEPAWLSRGKLKKLTASSARLWDEMGRDQVVYALIDHLQQEAENAFGLADLDKPVLMRSDIQLALLDYDLKTKREKFELETFDCGICLEPKKGKECHRLLSCRHVFCVTCLQDFYNNCITEGDVDSVKCLTPDCGKAEAVGVGGLRKRRKRDRTLNPSELLQIPIEHELVQRYVRLKRKKRHESKTDTIYCPRQWCQGVAWTKKHRKPIGIDEVSESESEKEDGPPPAKKEAKPEDIPMSQRLAICEDCDLAFCVVCKKVWHGEMIICNPRRKKEQDAEELASLDYLKRFSTPCPTCAAPAQKTMGCNHMICFKCQTHFCYLCSSWLNSDNPYTHFNDFKSNCYMRLWELEGGDGEAAGHNFHGIGGVGGWEEEFEAEEEEGDAAAPAEDEAGAAPIEQLALDDDTSDEEPAPDVRRHERAIEIVNFARGNQAQRIVLPDVEEPREVPPPAPIPPRPREGRGNNPRGRNLRRLPDQMRRRQPAQRPVQPVQQPAQPQAMDVQEIVEEVEAYLNARGANAEAPAEGVNLPRAAPGQGRADGNHPAPARAMGLERFLELAQNDREDEWDSDELDDDLDDDDDDNDDDRDDVRVDMNRIEERLRFQAGRGRARGLGRGMGQL